MNWFGRLLARLEDWLDVDRPAIAPEKIEAKPEDGLTTAQTLVMSFFEGGAGVRDYKAPHAYRPPPARSSTPKHMKRTPVFSKAQDRMVMRGRLFKGHRP